MHSLALALYRLLTWLAQPVVWLRLKARTRKEPLYGQQISERFGHYSNAPSEGWVWLHAVSLGETRAAAILLRELRKLWPNMKLLLTHGTATGREEGTKLLQEGDLQIWQPWDSAGATQRFFAHFKPRIGIVMETEVWPQLCEAAQQARVPLVLANARLNERSARLAQRLSALSLPAYASFAHVLAQTQQDALRLRRVGAGLTQALGNLKFDVAVDALLLKRGQALRSNTAFPERPVIMLAVSREGEEQQFIEQIKLLAVTKSSDNAINKIANNKTEGIVQWLIVPRHPQRFDEVARLCEQQGLRVLRRSSWTDAAQEADVWLGDSMGEMAMYYAMADVALLGGSFAPLGGQNLIEAIAAGCPVVMGPHTFNFQEASETAVAQGAARRAADMRDAVQFALELTQSVPSARAALQEMQGNGAHWLAQSRGASLRMAQAIASSFKR
jgi:3-deoxy-D-manno-octulosonic-acid transferase